ncbi:hypothetical protein MYAM1_002029 [Malassezia yamatoensis]|uniref:Major facilitator superfamily (MFS) profile domain-containing protein n=1 Tax=Malassezia yamatoensis TaxID=253288 RepID=A0AAJ5YSD1_9BASI|nr:hypothetical protein MYAM1_002029 [Malassezia yamatoensis]
MDNFNRASSPLRKPDTNCEVESAENGNSATHTSLPDEDFARIPHQGRDASLSFKRRRPHSPPGIGSWLRNENDRASIFSSKHLRHLREFQEGWEHPSRYPSASHVTMPTVLPTPESNPIPLLPYAVLCLLIFGEFCSAGVAGPFLFFMLDDFKIGDESQVGFWAGILASVFFFAQFLTSLLWASAAEKHGRRTVLQVSLVGSTLSLIAFGLSPNLAWALLFRLAQGFFNGAVGVAKGAVRDLTDETNESRAYAQMGFCWGMGGIIGPILGGLLEHPVQKYGLLFGKSSFLQRYPYALPCFVGSSFTALGALLSLFIEPHAGPKILQLPNDDEVSDAEDYRSWRSPSIATEDEDAENFDMTSEYSLPQSSMQGRGQSQFGSSYHAPSLSRGMSSDRQSRSTSGYQASFMRHNMRNASNYTARRMSVLGPSDSNDPEMSMSQRRESNMSLVERFVMANDDALLSVTDLWVAAATHGDDLQIDPDQTQTPTNLNQDLDSRSETQETQAFSPDEPPALFGSSFQANDREATREEPRYLAPAHFLRMHRTDSQASHHTTNTNRSRPEDSVAGLAPEVAAIPASLWTMIPVVIIVHYGVLSFHAATFEQVFLAFLVTPEPSGGLGLTAGHYAILIASMAVCQLYFQFRLYPNLGPPNGSLSHLAMFQAGLMLYLPCYLLFPFLRTFLLPNTDILVMFAMIAFATLRWLANVVSFTSVMVLLNAWTPPHLVPLANGLAQTVSSAARCVGPIFGGLVWGKSIQGGPAAHAWPLNYFLGFVIVGLVALFEALQARWLLDRS